MADHAAPVPALLKDYRALDLTDLKGQFCGRFLVDLGMEVIKVEPPGGDAVRSLAPFRTCPDGTCESLLFAHLNAGKKSVVIDLETAEGRQQLFTLARGADVVIESFAPGRITALGLGYEALRTANPGVVLASITGFGQTGPHRDYACTDIVAFAMSGLMYISGDPALAPCKPPEYQASYFGCLTAALGTVAALHSRDETGLGDWVDVSIQEALATQESLIRLAANEGEVLKRLGSMHAHVAPGKVFACRDGYVYLYMNRVHWERFLEVWKGHPPRLDDRTLLAEPVRRSKADMINGCIAEYTRHFNKAELTDLMQANRIPCTPVNRPDEWMRDEQVIFRNFVGAPTTPDDPVRPIAAPWLLNGARSAVGAVPILGGHQALTATPRAAVMRAADHTSGRNRNVVAAIATPLTGLRMIGFDHIVAGPYGATLLAELGADMIKIESRAGGLDMFRFFGKGQDPDFSSRFFDFNRNKRSFTVNVKSPEGQEIVKALARRSNAVLDNFGTHVMPSLGLDHASLAAERPDIVTLRMPGFGATGPKCAYPTVGPNISAITGITWLWNHPEATEPPVGSQTVLPDYVSGVIAATLLVAGAMYQKRTGQGAAFDLSQAEAASYLIGASLMKAQASGCCGASGLSPEGNASPDFVPQGCYPVKGEDRWCVISVENDVQWRVLADLIGRRELCADVRYATNEMRKKHKAEVDALIAAWTLHEEGRALMERLQAKGVPCGMVQTAQDLLSDPHLAARRFIVTLDHPRLGRIILPGFPIRFTNAQISPDWDFPVVGRDTGAICRDILGMAESEIQRLQTVGVLR